jgi:Cu+-exporting ATPase
MPREKVTFIVLGADCINCFISIEKSLSNLPNIDIVQVNHISEEVYTEYETKYITKDTVQEKIEDLGYTALEKEIYLEEQNASHQFYEKLNTIKVIINASITAMLMFGSVTSMAPKFIQNNYFQWFFATIVQIWAGMIFYKQAWKQLKNKTFSIDVLIILGSTVIFVYSTYITFFGSTILKAGISPHTYFETSAGIITFMLIGLYLQNKTKKQIEKEIRFLQKIESTTATTLRKKHLKAQIKTWIEIPIKQLRKNDILRIHPGERIPADGIIIEGSSTINEQMATGEQKLIFKKVSDLVICGTINITKLFSMKTIHVGPGTTFANAIELVKQAEQSKIYTQTIVDKTASIFIPIVVVIACTATFLWAISGPEPKLIHGIFSLISVLIVACPYILGLVTPTSIKVAIEKATQIGMLIKNGIILEKAHNITHVIFGKTGTLTRGTEEVEECIFADQIDKLNLSFPQNRQSHNEQKTYILGLIRAPEILSKHPVSQAVVRFLDKKFKNIPNYSVKELKDIPGFGIQALVDKQTILIGSAKLMKQEKIFVPQHIEDAFASWTKKAKSTLFVAINKKLILVFCLADTVRPEVKATLQALHKMGISSVMLTGDNHESAQEIAELIGIEKIVSNLMPREKRHYIRSLQTKKNVIAMIGDGINDAPAIATADIGIAMGSGSNITLKSADMVLFNNNLALILKLIKLSKITTKNLRQNLILVFSYNFLLIPLAMGVLYPFFGITMNPLFASATIVASSLSILLNSLRIKIKKL